MNPAKTDNQKLISCYACTPKTASAEFLFSHVLYKEKQKRAKGDILMYQIRQSFKPNEVTAEQAQKIAYELAMKFTKGKHPFIVCTHIDKDHIHTHIDFNSVQIGNKKKFCHRL